MPSLQISASRRGGTCSVEYAHEVRIQPGQRTIVTTFFPSDEHVRDFGVAPFSRHRVCLTCTASKLRELHRTGAMRTVRGLTLDDLIAAGLVTQDDVDTSGESSQPTTQTGQKTAADARAGDRRS